MAGILFLFLLTFFMSLLFLDDDDLCFYFHFGLYFTNFFFNESGLNENKL